MEGIPHATLGVHLYVQSNSPCKVQGSKGDSLDFGLNFERFPEALKCISERTRGVIIVFLAKFLWKIMCLNRKFLSNNSILMQAYLLGWPRQDC